jgi:hypothetical protein
MGTNVVSLCVRKPVGERGQDRSHYRTRRVVDDTRATGGIKESTQRVRGWMDRSAFGWSIVTAKKPYMEIGLHPDDTGNRGDRVHELVDVGIARDLTMEQNHVVVDHDVDVRQIEPLLQGAE